MSSQCLHFFGCPADIDLPENSTNWRMISMSSTLSPRGQSPMAKLPDKRAPDVVVPFFDSRFESGAELKAVLATGRRPD
jgi:hypothetical protein